MSQAQKPVAESDTPEHATAAPRNETGPESGAVFKERLFDPHREAIKRAQEKDYLRRQNPDQWVGLPNGESVLIQPGTTFMYPGDKTHPMLDHPGGLWRRIGGQWNLMSDENGDTTSILNHPKPPFDFGGVDSPRYAWFVRMPAVKDDHRPAETAQLHRGERIRYIEVAEVDKHSPIAIFEEYATPNNVYVTSGTMICAEILDPKLSYQKYKGWDDMAIQRVMSIPETVGSSPSVVTDAGPLMTHVRNKTVTVVDGPKEVRTGG